MPAFVWDIEQATPWFLYNAPVSLGGALYYFDSLTGFNTFPPPDHLLAGGGIFANPLPLVYGTNSHLYPFHKEGMKILSNIPF